MKKQYLRPGQVADLIGCCTRTVLRMIEDGELEAVKLKSSHRRIRVQSVLDFLAKQGASDAAVREVAKWD